MNITKALNLYEVFQNHFNRSDLELYLRQLEEKFPSLSFHEYSERVLTTLQYQQIDDLEKFTNLLIIEALANISESEPDWTF